MSRGRLLALGDSITRGEGDPAFGLPCRSWADWLARSLDLDLVNRAENGATVADVRRQLVAETGAAAAGPEPYAVAVVYAGVNDVRSPAFSLEAYRVELDALFAGAAVIADRLLTCTIPLDLGRPRAGAKVADANAVIREAATRHGAAVADLADLRGTPLLLPDAVHPTALGQLELADRAARALGLGPEPSATVRPDRSPRATARFALTNLLPSLGRDLRRRAVEGTRSRLGR